MAHAEHEPDKLVLKKSLPPKAEDLPKEQLRRTVIHTRRKRASSEQRTRKVLGLARSSLHPRFGKEHDTAG